MLTLPAIEAQILRHDHAKKRTAGGGATAADPRRAPKRASISDTPETFSRCCPETRPPQRLPQTIMCIMTNGA
jgi:hypothetical protein